ncbi:MAG: hypothetical protein IJN97_07915 [Oscillospiraceae bacterium]|nr:hypothetical protein [Oscillospiraceae bacterium]MBQ7055136.1 hypothetical protein [Oscillospiraceae bacterium]
MKILGLDIGTTTISTVVVENGKSLERETLKNDSFLRTANSWERIQSPEYIKKTALNAVNVLVRKYPDIKRVGVTGQMHGIVYLDKDGKAVSPLYTWQDERGNQLYKDGKTYAGYLSEISGYKLATGYGLVTHFYNMVNGLVPENAAKLCTIHDYIAMTLVGRCVPVTDCTDAASLGFFDVRNKCFDINILKELGIDTSLLPELSDGCIGCYRENADVQVYTAIGDNQASFLGATNGERSSILINVGTGSQFSAYTKEYIECEGLETRPFPGSGYLLVGASLCGGRAYALLENFYRCIAEGRCGNIDSYYDVMNTLLASGEKPQDLPEITPLFQGTRENPELRASITNLSADNFTPVHMTWALLEGMTRELYDMYLKYREKAENTEKKLVGSGNGLRKNPHFRKIVSEQFEMPLVMSECEEEAAVGAALYATMV